MARPEKVEAVEEIAGRFKETDAVLLTEYRGLRVADIREVRNALRDAEADYKVLKNTLTRLAVREVGLEELVGLLEGPTAIAFVKGDVAAAAKALDDAIQKFPVLSVKGGVLNGKIIDAEQAKALAKLESREILLAKVALLANAPAQQTVNVFAALLSDLGSMLAQVAAQKESEAPAAAEETPPETTAEEAAAEAEPPEETAEAVDQAPAAPESEAAETQESESDEKEEK